MKFDCSSSMFFICLLGNMACVSSVRYYLGILIFSKGNLEMNVILSVPV
jgi:hypothetical protein